MKAVNKWTAIYLAITALFGSVLIGGIILSYLPPQEKIEKVKEGGLVDVNQFIQSETLGGKEVPNAHFYLTYVYSNSPKNRLEELRNRWMGYEGRAASPQACSSFSYDDEQEYGHRILPYMSQNAIAAALHTVHIEPNGIWKEPVVLTTSYHSKIAKLFEPGDKLISLNGEEVTTGEDFNLLLNEHQEGDRVTVLIEREGTRKELSFIANERDCNHQLTAGIMPETTLDITNVDEEKVVNTKKMSFAGNSAGLMISLGIVQQLKPEVNLTHGKKIAGTGSINVVGNVGRIGSLDMKIRTAIKEGADVFLYPKSQMMDIPSEDHEKIDLIPVETLDEAIEQLTKLK
ncbi:PDZ domain-containing protein [Paenibacillus sp. 1182]|uniref:PDZ domain-containing protein n=1 Tax=Paenibacillus sp. 1182 TaxID=2806565 RepID=UPI001AE7D02A|nr:PDZ domain-containing protein [Paenibacillus sp. 1182]MBP1309206.1 PDZ domain-containing protein [Paenibacillus sp. 1182]